MTGEEPRSVTSKLKIVLGAASLFLFLVGVKRTFRTEDGSEFLSSGEEAPPVEPRRSERGWRRPLRAR